MKKILVAVDGSRDSEKAVEKSAEISTCFDSKVVLVYVQRFPGNIFSEPEMKELRKSLESSVVKEELESRSKAILRDAKSLLRKNSVGKVKTVIRWGHPAEEILKVAEEEKAELILVGSRGRRRGILLGSVSKEVVERAAACVMVAR
jgi:nucleotide-binding universal stress UspA family protein